MNTKTFCFNLLITLQPLSPGSRGFDTAVCCHLPVSAGSPAALLAGPAAECASTGKSF